MARKGIVFIFCVFLTGKAHSDTIRDLVRIVGANREDVRTIEKIGVLVNSIDLKGVIAEATQNEQHRLKTLGYLVEIIIPNINDVYKHNFLFSNNDGRYLTYPEFLDTMSIIARNNPDICKLETLGLSYNNYLILAMKISDNPQIHENEPAVHFEGCIHGDEKISAAIVFELIKFMVQNYGIDSTVTRLVNTREIWLLPIFNPDGYINSSRYNGNRVDLNRNWGWMWGDEANQGETPFSEPENKAVLNHIWRHPAVTYVSYHAGITFISHPFSYCNSLQNTIPELPLIQFLSARYDSFTHYTFGQGADSMYYINGSTKDFDYGYGMMGWSIEVHSDKTPFPSEIDPTFNLNKPAMLSLMHHAGQGISGTVTDAISGAPVPCQIWVNPSNWLSYNNPELGDFHRFYLPGTYQVTFRAPGYRETTLTNIVVPDSGDSVVTVDLQLTPDPSTPLFAFRHIYNSYVDPWVNHTYPVWALVPHDGDGFRLDNGKYICLDMGKPIHNRDGADLIVYRSTGMGTAIVQGSNSWEGPWINIGMASASETQLDIGASGLDTVRFIKITANGEFHLDAIEGTVDVGISFSPITKKPAPIKLHCNPASLPVQFNVERSALGGLLKILDPVGRTITHIPITSLQPVWNGKTISGNPVSPGVYFALIKENMPVKMLVITR
ncbi:MAG: M14 family zinc carboxypeptidase [bacterium]